MKPTTLMMFRKQYLSHRSLNFYLIIELLAQPAVGGTPTLAHFVELFPPKVGEVLCLVGHEAPVEDVQFSAR